MRLKALLARSFLWFLGRGMCICATADSRVKAEVRDWAEGVRIMLRVGTAGPAMAVEKRGGRLRFLGARQVPAADLTITFKHIDALLPVLLGTTTVTRAYAERRMTIRGDLTFAMSVVRVMLVVDAYAAYIRRPVTAWRRSTSSFTTP